MSLFIRLRVRRNDDNLRRDMIQSSWPSRVHPRKRHQSGTGKCGPSQMGPSGHWVKSINRPSSSAELPDIGCSLKMTNKSKQIKFRDWGGAGCRFQNRNQREISWINVSTKNFPRFFFFNATMKRIFCIFTFFGHGRGQKCPAPFLHAQFGRISGKIFRRHIYP